MGTTELPGMESGTFGQARGLDGGVKQGKDGRQAGPNPCKAHPGRRWSSVRGKGTEIRWEAVKQGERQHPQH